MDYQVYSKKTKQLYDNVEELVAAEEEFDRVHAEEIKRAEERKTRAKEIEDAYKNALQVRKDAEDAINAADQAYFDLKNKFIKDYGSFHMTFKNEEVKPSNISIFDLFEAIFR